MADKSFKKKLTENPLLAAIAAKVKEQASEIKFEMEFPQIPVSPHEFKRKHDGFTDSDEDLWRHNKLRQEQNLQA